MTIFLQSGLDNRLDYGDQKFLIKKVYLKICQFFSVQEYRNVRIFDAKYDSFATAAPCSIESYTFSKRRRQFSLHLTSLFASRTSLNKIRWWERPTLSYTIQQRFMRTIRSHDKSKVNWKNSICLRSFFKYCFFAVMFIVLLLDYFSVMYLNHIEVY